MRGLITVVVVVALAAEALAYRVRPQVRVKPIPERVTRPTNEDPWPANPTGRTTRFPRTETPRCPPYARCLNPGDVRPSDSRPPGSTGNRPCGINELCATESLPPTPPRRDPWPADPEQPSTRDPWGPNSQSNRPLVRQRPTRQNRRTSDRRRPNRRRPNGRRQNRRSQNRRNRRPSERQTGSRQRPGRTATEDPWPANPTRPTTRDPWPTERPNRRTTPSTTTPTPTGRYACQRIIADDDCIDFYSCFLNTQRGCEPQELPLALDNLVSYCVTSENVQNDNGFDRWGNRYIAEYRKCTKQRILQVVDSNSCSRINSEAEKILLTDDVIWDCLYQNGTLCDVINQDDNSESLGIIFAGTDANSYGIFEHLLKRVDEQCGYEAGQQFSDVFSPSFLSNTQGRMSGMMMMNGGNGGD